MYSIARQSFNMTAGDDTITQLRFAVFRTTVNRAQAEMGQVNDRQHLAIDHRDQSPTMPSVA